MDVKGNDNLPDDDSQFEENYLSLVLNLQSVVRSIEDEIDDLQQVVRHYSTVTSPVHHNDQNKQTSSFFHPENHLNQSNMDIGGEKTISLESSFFCVNGSDQDRMGNSDDKCSRDLNNNKISISKLKSNCHLEDSFNESDHMDEVDYAKNYDNNLQKIESDCEPTPRKFTSLPFVILKRRNCKTKTKQNAKIKTQIRTSNILTDEGNKQTNILNNKRNVALFNNNNIYNKEHCERNFCGNTIRSAATASPAQSRKETIGRGMENYIGEIRTGERCITDIKEKERIVLDNAFLHSNITMNLKDSIKLNDTKQPLHTNEVNVLFKRRYRTISFVFVDEQGRRYQSALDDTIIVRPLKSITSTREFEQTPRLFRRGSFCSVANTPKPRWLFTQEVTSQRLPAHIRFHVVLDKNATKRIDKQFMLYEQFYPERGTTGEWVLVDCSNQEIKDFLEYSQEHKQKAVQEKSCKLM